LDASIIAESIEVFDINGKLLHTEKMNSSSKSIDISRYAKGLYFLKLNAQSGEITVRFVKK
jgi:Secretion system C-terminal sorting domain